MFKKTKGLSAQLSVTHYFILLIKVNIISKNKALICIIFDVGGLLINAIGGGGSGYLVGDLVLGCQ